METVEIKRSETWQGYVDCRRRAAVRGRHGGFSAASFVLVVEVMENLAFLANASNLVMYLLNHMHFSPSRSANATTNFMATAFLLALLGGFLSDAYFLTFHVYLAGAVVEFLGLVILTVQAYLPSLQPPLCEAAPCQEPSRSQAAMLFTGLYLVAVGVGGIKGSLPTHGAEQFDESGPKGRMQRATFFNYFVFCLSAGGLIAVTFVVWVEDNKGWKWGFFIATMAILLSIPVFLAGSPFYRNRIPNGSPLTTILKVLLAAAINSCIARTPNGSISNMSSNASPTTTTTEDPKPPQPHPATTQSLTFLNRAAQPKPPCPKLKSTATEVEQVKVVLKILPIFASTIVLNCCLAQLSSFSVQQAATMNTHLASFAVPPASLPVFPVLIILLLAPLYDHLLLPFARRLTTTETPVSHLQRIGAGLLLSIAAMAAAALVEIKRKHLAARLGLLDSAEPLPISFLWIAFQYALLGSADLFSLAGMLEFFFTEAPSTMRSLATSLSFASLAVGYYMSSVVVTVVNAASGSGGRQPWLTGANINRYRLERFYWLLCVLSVLNFFNFLFWAGRYKYNRPNGPDQDEQLGPEQE